MGEGKRETTPVKVVPSKHMANNNKEITLCSLGGGTLRLPRDQRTTEEEGRLYQTTDNLRIVNDGPRLKPYGRLGLDVISGENSSDLDGDNSGVRMKRRDRKDVLKIGTWNVRTMNRKGKLENIKEEMKKNCLNVLGLSEVRWESCGDFFSDGYRIMYSGGKDRNRGVAIIVDKDTAKRVSGVDQISDRVMLIKLSAEPVDIVVVQVYMPTTEHEDEEIEMMYEQLEEILSKQKGTDCVVVMGDMNAVVGEGRDEKEVGKFGLGQRNDRGERLVEFCKSNDLVVTNTWFEQEKRRRYTWKKPGDTGRYQIDYILVKHRYRNSVKGSWSYPGADADSDHNLVAMRMRVKLKKIKKVRKKQKWDIDRMKTNVAAFSASVEERVACEPGVTVEKRWEKLKGTVIESAMTHIGYKKGSLTRKPWITKGMLDKMNERRKWKSRNTEYGKRKYRQLNNELRRETERAKAIWWEEQCNELEELDRRGRTDLVYAKVRKLTGKSKARNGNMVITDDKGKLLTEPDDVRKRWKEYIEILYDREGKPKPGDIEVELEGTVCEDEKGPELLRSEIMTAITEMKGNKAVGVDNIPAEFWKVLGEKGIQELVELCKQMYEQGVWPEDFTRVTMIPLQKKVNAVDCEDHRTISLISHASKVLLKILTRRIEAKVRDFIAPNQFGFRRGCGTREAIGVMRMLCERSLEYGNKVYICFVDFEKAFDRVNWKKLMEGLRSLQIDWRDRRMIYKLYLNQEAVVRIDDGESEPGIIGRGVRQGCPLSPLLFSIYAEIMMKEVLEDMDEGIRVGGRLVSDVRFADDQGMVSSSEAGLQRLMDSLNETAKKYDMKINIKKTKVMVVSKKEGEVVNIRLEGQRIEQVKKFKYLGSVIAEDGKCFEDIKQRIGMAKVAFKNKKELLTKNMKKDIRKRMVKTLIWPVALYGCETWSLGKKEVDRLQAFEMWIWRRMEKISWKDKKTNVEVLDLVCEERNLVDTILKRKKNWIGHIVRGEGLLKTVMEGRMEGKRGRGRPRIGMIDELKEGSYVIMKRKTEDREKWRSWMPRTCWKAEHL